MDGWTIFWVVTLGLLVVMSIWLMVAMMLAGNWLYAAFFAGFGLVLAAIMLVTVGISDSISAIPLLIGGLLLCGAFVYFNSKYSQQDSGS